MSSTAVQRRRGTTAEHATFAGLNGETTVDTTKKTVVVHDGATAGGNPLLREDGSNSALALGSAASPSLKFTGDPNTGLYSPGADQVAISTNGTGRLFVTADGKIGVNEASPLQGLHVAGNIYTANDYMSRNGGGIFLSGSGSYATGMFNSSGALVFKTGDAERFRLNSSGLLGLGTSSPSALLTIEANSTNTSFATTNHPAETAGILSRNVSNTPGNYQALTLLANNGSSAQSASLVVQSVAAGTPPEIHLTQRTGFNVNTTRLMVASSGNVGIGTTTVTWDTELARGAGAPAYFAARGNNNSAANAFLFGQDSSGLPRIFQDGNQPITFWTGSAATERARIDSSGRVLIGTSTSTSGNAPFQVRKDGVAITAELFCAQAGGDGVYLNLSKSRGSAASPAVVSSGDRLGYILFNGYSGAASAYQTAALIGAEVDGTPDTAGDTTDMPGRLVFSTTADGASSPTERMRITSQGELLFGRTTSGLSNGTGTTFGPTIALQSEGNATLIYLNRTSSDGTIQQFRRNNTIVGSIDVTTTSTSYVTSSDYRLKENVVPLTGAIDRLNNLQVHRFNFIADPDTTVDGFIAHEAQAVVPECVTGTKDEVDADGNPVYQGIDQSKLVPLLTAALQEAIAKIETLEAKIAALESA